MNNITLRNLLLLTIFFLGTFYIYAQDNKRTKKKSTVTDIDGNIYKTVKIGSQVWMTENLKTTRYNDSTLINKALNNWYEPFYANVSPGYCWYRFDSINYSKVYGALYNWYVVETKKLCPYGWHVPNEEEFQKLSKLLGGEHTDEEGDNIPWSRKNWRSKNKDVIGK